MEPVIIPDWVNWIILATLIWSLPWKAIALWKSARAGDRAWFLLILVLNTLGIVEIFYIFVFSKRTKAQSTDKK